MIPYINIAEISWLPSNIFGILVFSGCILGILWTFLLVPRYKITRGQSVELFILVIIPAYLGSHIFTVVFYFPELLLTNPLILFQFNNGLSSIGGVISAVLAFILFLKLTSNFTRWREYSDILTAGFLVGWIFGRLGCTITHDHPGIMTDFFLAVQFPGGARHDLGLYEFMYTLLVLFPISTYIHFKGYKPGSQLVMFFLVYSVFRFPIDFLRVKDATYFGLTPAQYGCVLLFVAGIILFRKLRKKDPG